MVKIKNFSRILRWVVVVATLVFISKTFYDNWSEVQTLELDNLCWLYITAALVVSLLSHIWLGVLWAWILRDLQYPVPWRWASINFITVEIAKYLPGGVWHVYARLKAARKQNVPIEVGIISVLLASYYIGAAGLGFSLFSFHLTLSIISGLGLICMLIAVHPYYFDRLIDRVGKLQNGQVLQPIFRLFQKNQPYQLKLVGMKVYPWQVILGHFLFVGLRSISFLLTVLAFTSIEIKSIAPLISGFSFAWTLGLILPGVSGGVGVFEAIAIALLEGVVSDKVIIGSVICYRLVGTLTEALGSLLGLLVNKKDSLRNLLHNRNK